MSSSITNYKNKITPAWFRRLQRAGLVAFLLTLLLVTTASAALVNRKLSGTMQEFGEIFFAEISPDGQTVVYVADQEVDERFELYSVPADGGSPPLKLNGPLGSGGFVDIFQISPDSSRVIYVTLHETGGAYELYSVPIGGGSPVKLNGPLVSGGSIFSDFKISPDSSWVVYWGDQETDDVFEIYRVPLDGSAAPVKLNGPLVSGGFVDIFQISPDNSRVVYLAQQDTVNVFELYSVPLDGSAAPVKLNGPLVSGGGVMFDFKISPDSSRVVFRADYQTNDVVELGSVPIDGSSLPVNLSGPLVSGGDVQSHFKISPDGSRVVFRADYQTDNAFELGSVPIDGSAAPVRLNGPLVSDGDVQTNFHISPDSSRVVYSADQETDEVEELYSVPLDASASPVKLNTPLVSGGDVIGLFQISPDSSRVVYTADQETDEMDELFSAPLDGSGSPVKLSGPLAGGGDVIGIPQFSPDSGRVVYIADQETDEVYELYSVTPDGSTSPLKLNGPLVSGGNVEYLGELGLLISPDSSQVVYTADQETDEVFELFVTFGEPPAPPVTPVYLPLVMRP